MKRLISLVCAVVMMLTLLPAQAATVIDGAAKRKISIQEAGTNEVEEGISPTTGLTLSDYDVPEGFAGLAATGRYLPMLVQIDNGDGGVRGMAPWGASYVDIVYESPLHSKGFTRISYLFSDLIPTSVGPVRSARVGHAWLREEWDAGFLYYGGQERAGSNIKEEFQKTGATKKGVLFSGTVGENKPWKKFYNRRKGIPSPHNVNANVAAMSELIPADFVPPNHAFKFTDDIPQGDPASTVNVSWNAIHYGSSLSYDADNNVYYRYMHYENGELVPYEDRDSQEQLGFANVIVQYTTVRYNGSSAAPVTTHVGDGNADYFMGGVHTAGVWKRKDMASRTVFYGADGQEISLQRGKTLIIIIPQDNQVTYE